MRVTQNYSIHSLLRQVNHTRERINTLQRDLATGKRINQISDDPYKIESVLRYRKMIKQTQRFKENINSALDFMHFTSSVLNDVGDVLASIKEIAIQGADDLQDSEFNAHANQVDELLKELVNLANKKFKDRYIFGGSNTGQTPFTINADVTAVESNPAGIDGKLRVEVGNGKIESYNISGKEVFQGKVDVFQTVLDLRNAFQNKDSAAISNAVEQLDSAISQVLEQNTRMGSKIDHFQGMLDQFDLEEVKLRSFLSKLEDTDMAKAITDLQMEQTALQTSLQVLAQTMNISLVDFIK